MAVPAQHASQTLREHHWSSQLHGTVTELAQEAAAATPAVRSLSHYSAGTLDFVVCRARRAPLSSTLLENGDDLQDESLAGSRLLLCTQDLGSLLRPLGTGELMRTIVANAGGGLWGGRVKPGEYLAAVADAPDDVQAMDEAMNELVTRIRTQVHKLPSEMLGGPASAPVQDTPLSAQLRVDYGTAAEPDGPYEQRLRALWGSHLSTSDLQYAAYYRDRTLVCVGDVFDAPDLGPRFMDVSVRTRRTAYRDLAFSLGSHLARLADALCLVAAPGADQPVVERLVLDVQEGAVFVTWPSADEFVVGVTLDQTQVRPAEDRLTRLAAALHKVTLPRQR